MALVVVHQNRFDEVTVREDKEVFDGFAICRSESLHRFEVRKAHVAGKLRTQAHREGGYLVEISREVRIGSVP